MSNCKHYYYYVYDSAVRKSDIRSLKFGTASTTVPRINVDMKMAFYICSKCHHILITERLNK